ncbi:TetR/AcrR family transcriptional regulator C-terminal ligand-binding domain-containing protein [Streptomyces diacarni]|uniref:TetR/AcrR family transcriptional regulator n=1 Tax=Streptomyces diacarni TaxID=2800381 RepID=A0A367EGZ2_9ACTN|nr:TetR/AcrR family transcriptional regulator [Streptomyces diacarni]RCG17311.1 TetR/AcrR family transcriptional regulator [Streptomyces diacarni]
MTSLLSVPPTPSAASRSGTRRTRLTPERENELFTAVLDLVRDVGYETMTMEAVALASRCSKATLYRQWRDKPCLVAAALRHMRPFRLDHLDTGSLRGDLYELARRMGGATKDLDLMRGVVLAIRKDADLAEAVHAALVQPEIDVLNAILERAVARGETDPGNPAAAFLSHMISGAVFSRPMLEQREADATYLVRYLDAVILPALTRTPTP